MAKRDQNRPREADLETAIRKPGMETSHVHIAGMFSQQGHQDIANSLVLKLMPHLQKRVSEPRRRK